MLYLNCQSVVSLHNIFKPFHEILENVFLIYLHLIVRYFSKHFVLACKAPEEAAHGGHHECVGHVGRIGPHQVAQVQQCRPSDRVRRACKQQQLQ